MRLSTKRGTLWNDPEYGFAVTELVNENLTAESLASIPARVEAELEKDDRLLAVDVTSYLSGSIDNRKIRLDIRITPNTGATVSFAIDVSALSVELLTGAVA